MKSRILLMVIFILAFSCPAFADSRRVGYDCDLDVSPLGPAGRYSFPECQKTEGSVSPDFLSSQLANVLCENLKCDSGESSAISDYISKVSPSNYKDVSEVGRSNLGLRKFFMSKIESNSCFGALAFRFYQELSYQMKDEIRSSPEITLNSESQKGKVWKLAQHFAGGDPNLATALIGVCGHDNKVGDYGENRFVYCLDPEDSAAAKKAGGQECATENKGISFSCPAQSSAFFSDGGLEQINIPPDLKTDLAKAYAPQLPSQTALGLFPLKYYHVYGSAYATCELVERGVPAQKSRQVEKMTSLVYRALRVCDNATKNISNFNSLLDKIKEPKIAQDAKSELPDPKQWTEVSKKVISFLNARLEVDDEELLVSIGLLPPHTHIPDEETKKALKEKITNYPGIVLAGYLTQSSQNSLSGNDQLERLRQFYGDGAETFGSTLESLRSKIDSPLLRMAGGALHFLKPDAAQSFTQALPCIKNTLINFGTGRDLRCDQFNDCNTARAKLGTYQADFLQTLKYHELGAKFAADQCKAKPATGDTYTTGACAALAKLRTQNPNGFPAKDTALPARSTY